MFCILPGSFGIFVMDWSKILAYNGYYGAKTLMTLANILKRKGILSDSRLAGILAMFLVVAFLGFASVREAKTKER